MTDFLPVLLGSDANVYGMARSFFEEYGLRSACICKRRLIATQNTRLLCEVVEEPRLEEDEVFVATLRGFAERHAGRPLLLVSCADGYTILMARNRAALDGLYRMACPDLETVLALDMKERFYKACEAHGLSYPKTAGCTVL